MNALVRKASYNGEISTALGASDTQGVLEVGILMNFTIDRLGRFVFVELN